MTDHESPPIAIPGVGFAEWLVPGRIARGAQPPHTRRSQEALARHGVREVLSLRCDDEPLHTPKRPHRYRAEHERAACAMAGLEFHRVPCADLAAPAPEQILASLAALDSALAADRAVYLHCRAGLGRTGVVAAAWLMARGGADVAAAGSVYREPFHALLIARGHPEDQWPSLLSRIGVAEQWWAIRSIGSALGLRPADLSGLPEPRQPANVRPDEWIAAVESGLRDRVAAPTSASTG